MALLRQGYCFVAGLDEAGRGCLAGPVVAAAVILPLTEVQDLLPTLIDLCGLQKRRQTQFDGASLAGLLRGIVESLPDRMLIVQYR